MSPGNYHVCCVNASHLQCDPKGKRSLAVKRKTTPSQTSSSLLSRLAPGFPSYLTDRGPELNFRTVYCVDVGRTLNIIVPLLRVAPRIDHNPDGITTGALPRYVELSSRQTARSSVSTPAESAFQISEPQFKSIGTPPRCGSHRNGIHDRRIGQVYHCITA